MALDYDDPLSPHRLQLAAFLNSQPMDIVVLEKCRAQSDDPRVRDLCRMLLKAARAERLSDIAGTEEALDALLIERNSIWIRDHLRVVR